LKRLAPAAIRAKQEISAKRKDLEDVQLKLARLESEDWARAKGSASVREKWKSASGVGAEAGRSQSYRAARVSAQPEQKATPEVASGRAQRELAEKRTTIKGLQSEVADLTKRASGYPEDAEKLVRSLLPHQWLWRDTGFDWTVIEGNDPAQRNRWERD